MITTEHMGLVLWDLERDDFEHSKLADNFVKIDQHNHAGLVTEGKYKNEDTEEAEKTTPNPKTDILNYAENNAGVAKWNAVGQGEGIRTPQTESPTDTAIKPESIWRYLLALRSVGHRQLDVDGVWAENLKDESVERPKIKKKAVDTEQLEEEAVTGPKLEKGLFPLGIVVAWYKSPAEPTPGPKWAVCEGQEWKTVENELGASYAKLETGNVPNLIDTFIRGTNAAGIGTTGGASTYELTHSHTVDGHTHTVNAHSHTVSSHTHSISEDGKHHHTFASGYQLGSRRNAFVNHLTLEGHTPTAGQHVADLQSAYLEEFNEGGESASASMDQNGEHDHGGATGAATPGTSSVALTSNVTAPGTNTALEDTTIEPPWYGLCQIIKVKR